MEETWLRLVEHAGRLKPETPLCAWLFTVARNLFISYCRSRAVEDARGAGLMGLWPGRMPESSPFAEAAAGEMERFVERALSEMPVHFREVLLLSWIEEMTPAEMAVVCGITPEALRQRLSRARALLVREIGTCWSTTRAQDITRGDTMSAGDFELDIHPQIIAGLPAHEPDCRCTDQVRARCHARIRRQKKVEAVPSMAAAWIFRRIFEPSLVTAACAVFLCEVLRRAILLYGF